MKRTLLLSLGFALAISTTAQNVGINNNGAAPNANAILDVDVTTNNKGILIPRLTTAQRTAIGGLGAGDEGLTVYDETTNSYWLWDGTQWVEFSMGGAGWLINGNGNTTQGTNFVGTTNAQGVDFRTNNTLRFRIANGNQVQANANGTQTVPFYSWIADPNTGMWRQGTDELAFSAGGVEFMLMDANGADRLVVNDGSGDMDFIVESNGNANMLHVNGGLNEVGIGKVPTEALDVNGNLRFSGALMPNNQPGTANMMLMSAGAGAPPVWGNQMLNTPATTAMGKFFSGLFNIPTGTLTFTLADPNCVVSSTCAITWVGNLPIIVPGTPNYGQDLEITYEAQAGQWVFHIQNNTGFNLNNFQFSYFAFY